jgi:hypothetical protein
MRYGSGGGRTIPTSSLGGARFKFSLSLEGPRITGNYKSALATEESLAPAFPAFNSLPIRTLDGTRRTPAPMLPFHPIFFATLRV